MDINLGVLVNNKELIADLLSAQITSEANKTSSAILTFIDGDPATGAFPLSDGNDCDPGNSIIIKAGYGFDQSVIFSGFIVKHNLDVSTQGGLLILRCEADAATVVDSDAPKDVVLGLAYGSSIISINMTADVKNKNSGTVTFQGSAAAVPGKWVEISGMSRRFNDDAFVSAVTHTFESGNWITALTLGVVE